MSFSTGYFYYEGEWYPETQPDTSEQTGQANQYDQNTGSQHQYDQNGQADQTGQADQSGQADLSGQTDQSGHTDTSGQYNYSGQGDISGAGLYNQHQSATETAQPQYDTEGSPQEQDSSQQGHQQNYEQQNYEQNYETSYIDHTQSSYDPSQTNYDPSNLYNYDPSQPMGDSNQHGTSLTTSSFEPAECPPPTTHYVSDDVTTPRGDVTGEDENTEVDGIGSQEPDLFSRQRQDTLTNEGQVEEAEVEDVAPPPQGGFTFFNPNQFGWDILFTPQDIWYYFLSNIVELNLIKIQNRSWKLFNNWATLKIINLFTHFYISLL